MTILVYLGAAVAEIVGCFAFWAVFRLDRPGWWLFPGIVSLAALAWLLTLVDAPAAGRAFSAYGGVYIAASLAWLWVAGCGLRKVFAPIAGIWSAASSL